MRSNLIVKETNFTSLRFPTTESQGIPQTLILLASSNAELSLTPRYEEVAVTELCPNNLLTASTLCVLS